MTLAPTTQLLPALQLRNGTHRAADILVDQLVKAGVDTIFGIPGGTIVALNDALIDRPEIRVVTARHESGAMFAAAGYARATGKLGVVMVTSGPGALNCMTGLASAYCDSLPLLLLAGEVPRSLFGKGALQEGSSGFLNVIGMAKHITKYAFEMTDANSAPSVLRKAITTACSGRPGPVMLTMPLDVTTAVVRRPGLASDVRLTAEIDGDLVRKVAGALLEAERPAILAGSGVRWGRGPQRLRELAERLQCPVVTTPKAKGVFPESHPLSLGVFGHGGHPSASRYLEDGIDLLLAVGTGLSDPATNGWSKLLEPSGHFIQIDADVTQMGRNYAVSVGLVGQAETILKKLVDQIPPIVRRAKSFGIERHTDAATFETGADGMLAPQRALWELQQVMPTGTVYTCDIGEHLLFATHYLHIDDPQGWLTMTGLASMGSSIAGAIGMRLGKRDRPAVAICGDGCFAMGLGDLSTAVRERIPIVIAVINDKRYGMVELGHVAIYGRTPSYACDELDIPSLALGMGAESIVIEKPGQILELDIESRLARGGPLVLDIRIDRSVRMPKNKRFEQLGKSTQWPQKAPEPR